MAKLLYASPHLLEIKCAVVYSNMVFRSSLGGKRMKLSEAAVGTKVKIVSVNFQPDLQGRILGLGFVPGAIVEVIREAPFGDPRVYMVHGKMITLRNSEADLIEVQPVDRSFPLSMAEIGRRYVIKAFLGGPFFMSRVRSMGL
ncbi:FeoA family protein, partial [Thermococcus sp.]|uniref:FeoA family protein n=1 Tax=Thermococcus sp. TaxID=35749 RepID=UPI002602A6CA